MMAGPSSGNMSELSDVDCQFPGRVDWQWQAASLSGNRLPFKPGLMSLDLT
jgi:hypothetical protein